MDLFCFQESFIVTKITTCFVIEINNKPFLGSVSLSNGPCDITDYGSFFIFKSREEYDFAQNCLITFQCESNSRAIIRIDECSIPLYTIGVPFLEIVPLPSAFAKFSKENISTPDQCSLWSPLTSADNYINITSYIPEPSNDKKSKFKLQLECFGS